MKIIGIWFTFGLDAECLVESIHAFKRVFPNGIVCINDDQQQQIPWYILEKIKPNEYEIRNWNSSKNLNGWDTIRGILDFQIKMQELYPDAVGAIKIDSDTLILEDSWLDIQSPICGFSAGAECLVMGMCRYLRKDVPENILNFLKTRWLWEGDRVRPGVTVRVPEDSTIASYCALLYGMECKSIDWCDGASAYSYEELERNTIGHKVVNFGNRHQIKLKGDADRRYFASQEMKKYNYLIDPKLQEAESTAIFRNQL